MTSGDVSRTLGLHVNTVCRAADAGELESYRVPGSTHRRFTPDAVWAYAVANNLTVKTEARL